MEESDDGNNGNGDSGGICVSNSDYVYHGATEWRAFSKVWGWCIKITRGTQRRQKKTKMMKPIKI